MKTNFYFRFITPLVVLLLMVSGIQAQDPGTTPGDTTPVATPAVAVDTTPVAATTTAPAEETKSKDENDGFNSKSRFGIRVGGIISKQAYESGTPTEDPESKFGADLAIVYAMPIGRGFFMLQPELHYLQKGYTIANTTNGELNVSLNYLELPILLRVNFGSSIRFFGFAGPSIGWLLDGTYENDLGEQDASEVLDDIEYSGHIGLGAGLGPLELDVRYIAGLSDISNSDDFTDAKNSSFGIGLTLKF